MTRNEAGRLGAKACMEKYGVEFFRINGARGGRPRALTIDDLTAKPQLGEDEKGGMDTPLILPDDLHKLKRLWKRRCRAKNN